MKNNYIPDRGDIVWANFDPRVGHEQSGHRRAIVLSRREFNEHTGFAMLCPITSKVKGQTYEVRIKAKTTDGAVLPAHLKSFDMTARNVRFIEKSPPGPLMSTLQIIEAIIG